MQNKLMIFGPIIKVVLGVELIERHSTCFYFYFFKWMEENVDIRRPTFKSTINYANASL